MPFDRIMVHTEIAHHLKLRRLTDAEKWAFVAGVLPIAGKADLRGALLIGSTPADAEDVAHQARVSVKVARGCLDKLRAVGMLEFDEDIAGEWVHDFDQWNPEPKRDGTAAKRAREYRERQKAKRSSHHPSRVTSRVTDRDVTARHAPEVEGEEEGEEQRSGVITVDELAGPPPALPLRRVR